MAALRWNVFFRSLFPSSVEQPLTDSSPLELRVICSLVTHEKVFYYAPLSAHAETRRNEIILDFEWN